MSSTSTTWPQLPLPVRMRIRSAYPSEIGYSIGLQRQATSRLAQRWAFDLTYAPGMEWPALKAFAAHMLAQRGRVETFTFYLQEHLRGGTWFTNSFTPACVGAYVAGDTVINVDGLTATAGTSIEKGDFVQFSNHAKIYMAVKSANAALGDANLTIEPPLIAALPDNTNVYSQQTTGDLYFTVVLAADDFEFDIDQCYHYGFSVTLIEAP